MTLYRLRVIRILDSNLTTKIVQGISISGCVEIMNNSIKPFCQKHLKLLLCVALAAIIVLVFFQTYNHEFINFDDNTYITANPNIKNGINFNSLKWAFTTGHEGNWHPLTWISHLIDYELYGLKPTGHHLTNVLLHAVNSLLLFLLLTKLTGTTYRSFFVAVLFAVHPLHVESVAWAAERKDVLCAFFWMFSIMLYVRYVEQPLPGRYLALIVAFTLGLLCKPIIVTLPLTLLVIDYWPLNRRPDTASVPEQSTLGKSMWSSFYLIEKTPLLVLAFTVSLITFQMQKEAGGVTPVDFHNILLNSGNAAISYIKYITQMVWPSRLAVFYPFIEESISITKVIFSIVIIGLATALATAYRKRFPYIISGWLWYMVTILPVIGILRIGRQAHADRYTYIPLIGLFVVVVWGLSDLSKAFGIRTRYLAVFAVAVISSLMFTAYRQVGYWQNSYTLFRHAEEYTVNNCITQNNIGEALMSNGKYHEAYRYIIESIRIKPNFEVAHNNMGIINFNMGKLTDAEEAFQTSLKIKPSYATARYNLAVMYSNLGKTTLALNEYLELTKTAPELATKLKVLLDRQTY